MKRVALAKKLHCALVEISCAFRGLSNLTAIDKWRENLK